MGQQPRAQGERQVRDSLLPNLSDRRSEVFEDLIGEAGQQFLLAVEVPVQRGVSDGLCKRSVLKEDQDDRCDH